MGGGGGGGAQLKANYFLDGNYMVSNNFACFIPVPCLHCCSPF